MQIRARLFAALVVGLLAGFGVRQHDRSRGAEWIVSPEQMAAAREAGRPGVEAGPGTLAVLPIRSETADLLPLKWVLIGLGAGFAILAGTGYRRPPPSNRR